MRIQCEMYILPAPSDRAIIFNYLCYMRRNKTKTVTPFVNPSVGKVVEKIKERPSRVKFVTKEVEYKTKTTPKVVYKEKEKYSKNKEQLKIVKRTGLKRVVLGNDKKKPSPVQSF